MSVSRTLSWPLIAITSAEEEEEEEEVKKISRQPR